LNASLPEPVLAFLRGAALAAADEAPAAVPLTGGVSSDIWKVELRSGPVCVKRALPRLRVAQLWEAPIERNRYEWRWMQAAARISPGSAPRVLAHDEAGFFAMEFLDGARHALWKNELRAGRADAQFARQVGERLARIHAATANDASVASQFATDASFHALRLEPYLLATARAASPAARERRGARAPSVLPRSGTRRATCRPLSPAAGQAAASRLALRGRPARAPRGSQRRAHRSTQAGPPGRPAPSST